MAAYRTKAGSKFRVEAYRLDNLNGDETKAIPGWVMRAARHADLTKDDWVVKTAGGAYSGF